MLKEMKSHGEYLPSELEEFLYSFQKLTALAEVAYLTDSGLSGAGIKSLIDINRQATKFIIAMSK